MDNNLVLERISNLKGRLGYEEKKAKKLGFASLYDYMEEKINKTKGCLFNEINFLLGLVFIKNIDLFKYCFFY